MNRLVTLRDFINTYSITKEEFLKETNKDKEFYDKYIEWESRDEDTIITPKALEKLGEIFNKPEEMPVIAENSLKEAEKEILEKAEPDKPKRKRRTKKEMEESRVETTNPYMPEPTAEETKDIKEVKETKTKTADKPRKKKTKLNITRQFIAENGTINGDISSIKQLRQFLMSDGNHKIEQVALMSDQEVLQAFEKDYFVIKTEEGRIFIFPRQFMNANTKNIYVIEQE